MTRWGVVKRRGNNRTLLLDYDRKRRPDLADLGWRAREMGIAWSAMTAERSHSRGWHVVVYLAHPLTAGELVAAQALMGSDAARERYNLMRVIAGAKVRDWNLLFARKLTERAP